jgi:alpha-galactosidase
LGCGAPLGPSIGLVNGMRVSGDTYYSFGQPFLFWFLNTFFFAGFEGLPSMKDALKTSMLRAFMHNKFWINDPDCLLVRRTRSSLKPTEIEFEVTLLGLCGGILFSSDKLSELAPEDLDLIKFLLPPSRIPAAPLDLFENDPPMYFKLDLPPSESIGACHLVGIFNWTKKVQQIPLSLEHLNLDSNLHYHVFDFWEKRYYQLEKNDKKELQLKSHTAKLLAIRPITEGPQLISSTFHITQGNIEISKFEFDPNALEISIEVVKSDQNHGHFFLYLPRPYHPKELLSDAKYSKLALHQDELVGIEMEFEERSQLTLKLEKKE